jgi:hypothetical protein
MVYKSETKQCVSRAFRHQTAFKFHCLFLSLSTSPSSLVVHILLSVPYTVSAVRLVGIVCLIFRSCLTTGWPFHLACSVGNPCNLTPLPYIHINARIPASVCVCVCVCVCVFSSPSIIQDSYKYVCYKQPAVRRERTPPGLFSFFLLYEKRDVKFCRGR